MNSVTALLGLLLIGAGFVMFIWRLHDRSVHDAIAVLRAGRQTGSAVAEFASLIAPAVSAVAGGLAFFAISLASRTSPEVLTWIRW